MLGDKVQQQVERPLEIIDFISKFSQCYACQTIIVTNLLICALIISTRAQKYNKLEKKHLHFKKGFVKIFVVTIIQEGGAADGKM